MGDQLNMQAFTLFVLSLSQSSTCEWMKTVFFKQFCQTELKSRVFNGITSISALWVAAPQGFINRAAIWLMESVFFFLMHYEYKLGLTDLLVCR